MVEIIHRHNDKQNDESIFDSKLLFDGKTLILERDFRQMLLK